MLDLTLSTGRYTAALTPEPERPRFRLCWDDETPHWNFKCRTQSPEFTGPDNPPAVNKLYKVPSEKSGDLRVNLEKDPSWRWKETFIKINGSYSDWEYVQDKGLAIFNTTGWAQMAYLGFSGNAVNVLERRGEWYRIETLKPTDWLRAQSMTHASHPEFIHSFSCVTWDRQTKTTKRIFSTGTQRGQVYVPLVTVEGQAWTKFVVNM